MQVIKHTFTILKMNMELICDLNVSYFPQALVACTLEFQIEGGGRNKRGRWQISAKIINGEGAINGEVDKYLQS